MSSPYREEDKPIWDRFYCYCMNPKDKVVALQLFEDHNVDPRFLTDEKNSFNIYVRGRKQDIEVAKQAINRMLHPNKDEDEDEDE